MRAAEGGGRTARCVCVGTLGGINGVYNMLPNHQMLDRRLKLGWRGGRFS